VAIRLAAAAGDTASLPPIPKSRRGLLGTLHNRLFTIDHRASTTLLGPFSANSQTAWKFVAIESSFKVLFVIITAIHLASPTVGAVSDVALMAMLLVVTIQYPPFMHRALSSFFLGTRLFVLWTMILAIAVLKSKDDKQENIAIAWWVGVVLFLPIATIVFGKPMHHRSDKYAALEGEKNDNPESKSDNNVKVWFENDAP
jgi:hypothetical protein